MPQRKRTVKPTSSNPFPYRKSKIRIPREMESASSLWLDFFQQFCDIVIDKDGLENATRDRLSITRARILADHALETFQDRFPGVHP